MESKTYTFGEFNFYNPIFHYIFSDTTSDRKVITGASGTTKSTCALIDTLYWQVMARGEPKIYNTGKDRLIGKQYVELNVGIVKRTIKDLQATIHEEIKKVFGPERGLNILKKVHGEQQPSGCVLEWEHNDIDYKVKVDYKGVDLSRETITAGMYGWSPSILLVSEFNHLTADAISFFILRTREGYMLKDNRPYICFEGQAPSPTHALFMKNVSPFYTKAEMLDKKNWAGIVKQKVLRFEKDKWIDGNKKRVEDKITTTLFVMPSHVVDEKANANGMARENPYAIVSPVFSDAHIVNLVSTYRDDQQKYDEHLIGVPTYQKAGNHFWEGFGHKNIDEVMPSKRFEIFISTDADSKAVPLLWQYNSDTKQYMIIDAIGSRKDPQDMRLIGARIAQTLREKYAGYTISPTIACDPSGASGTASTLSTGIIEEMNKGLRDEGMNHLEAVPLPYKYNKRLIRRSAVSRLCSIVAENGLPKLVINKDLEQLVNDVTDYTWKEDDKGEAIEPRDKEKVSTCDAVEYGAVRIMLNNEELNMPGHEYIDRENQIQLENEHQEELVDDFYESWGDRF